MQSLQTGWLSRVMAMMESIGFLLLILSIIVKFFRQRDRISLQSTNAILSSAHLISPDASIIAEASLNVKRRPDCSISLVLG
jgi:hypothetical protein